MSRRRSAAAGDLRTLVFAALGGVSGLDQGTGWKAEMLAPSVQALRDAPAATDRALVALADALALDDADLLAAALCIAVSRDPVAARALAEAQHPLGGSQPLLGTIATALAPLGTDALALASGPAVASGLLVIGDEPTALPERSLAMPLPLLAVLAGRPGAWGGIRLRDAATITLPDGVIAEAGIRAGRLGQEARAGLVIRSPSLAEAEAVAGEVARRLDRGLAAMPDALPAGLAPWLIAAGRLPLFRPSIGPGERWIVPDLGAYAGPWIAIAGPDGSVVADAPPDEWALTVPDIATRATLWRAAGLGKVDADRAAASFRQGAGRIAEASRRARFHAAWRGENMIGWGDLIAGVAAGAGDMDALARRSDAQVPDEALVLPPALAAALHRFVARGGLRSTLHDGLGVAITSRYRPGMRALFTGESGTGKTLAAHWLAGQLGLPLYRVDMAALTSKWIGETEKNLSALLSAAEHADVLLFFDEADSLFGARTEVGDANDRHANAQTNFLLQRIEEFDGIAILASNSRDRFDPAFVRRLDAILEFPMPEAPARRALWVAHLGEGHSLDAAELDRLALVVDLAGGHIRNIVLAAAARAREAARRIAWDDIAGAALDEYAKLGRPPPYLG